MVIMKYCTINEAANRWGVSEQNRISEAKNIVKKAPWFFVVSANIVHECFVNYFNTIKKKLLTFPNVHIGNPLV